ncbi:MAG: hypothetical protein ABSB35_37585 [Bryobacteraceae bacterium]|jgi:DNA polymerase III delta subunit
MPVPLTAQRFYEQVEQRARQMGVNCEGAVDSLLAELSTDDLHRPQGELEQIALGGKTTGGAVKRRKARESAAESS